MSAERKPQTEASLLERPLKLLTLLVARFPVSVITISALLVALSLTGAQLSLGFRTSRADLLNPKSEHNRRWNEFAKEFGEQDDVTVVVHSENPQAVPPILDQLAAQLNRQPRFFRLVQHKIDIAKLRSKGLYNDQVSLKMLGEIDGLLNQSQGLLQGDLNALNLGGQIAWFAAQTDRADPHQPPPALANAQEQQRRLLEIMAAALSQPGQYQSPLPDMSALRALCNDRSISEYKLLKDGRVGLIALFLEKEKSGSFAEYSEGLAALRQLVNDAKRRHPEAWVGLTGIPVMENDEMESSQSAMAQAGILSFIGVGLLYIAGFGCVRHPAMALAALLVPMGWAFGYILLTVGHLNILSSAFATIVIGLGSDYGVYHIAQYLRLRAAKMSTFEALMETARSVGPGLTTSAAATALAFFTIGLSDFPGIAELGIIAGGGILLCWLASLTTLPALLHWSDAHRGPWAVPAPLDVYAYVRPLVNRPKLVVAGYAVFTVLVCFGIKDLWYDHNLLNLQAKGLESVELEKSLLQSDCGASFATVMAKSREEVVARKAMYLNRRLCPMVDSVDEIATCLPADTTERQPLIKRIHDRLAAAQWPQQAHVPVLPPPQLERAAAKLQADMLAMKCAKEATLLKQIRDLAASLPEREYYARLTAFQDRLAAETLQCLQALRGMSNPEPPTLADFPEGVVARLVGRSGYYCMQIHTKADIWNMTEMEQFVGQLRAVDKMLNSANPAIDTGVTGNPVQVYESSREMMWGYEKGALYGIIIVVAVVFLDFRSIRMTLLALLPLVTSKLQLFGLMGLLGIPLNPANMIVLPLILGIGVDTGVQIVHDYLREPHPYRMPPSTSAALVINTLMNIVGFGALMIASHRGLHSLGRVLTLGMACCLLSCLVMPSLLQILPDMRPKQPSKEQPAKKVADSGIELASGESTTPAIRRKAA
jgi:hopanoid biosynthesis associated RND transporter like protein HpnN